MSEATLLRTEAFRSFHQCRRILELLSPFYDHRLPVLSLKYLLNEVKVKQPAFPHNLIQVDAAQAIAKFVALLRCTSLGHEKAVTGKPVLVLEPPKLFLILDVQLGMLGDCVPGRSAMLLSPLVNGLYV